MGVSFPNAPYPSTAVRVESGASISIEDRLLSRCVPIWLDMICTKRSASCPEVGCVSSTLSSS